MSATTNIIGTSAEAGQLAGHFLGLVHKHTPPSGVISLSRLKVGQPGLIYRFFDSSKIHQAVEWATSDDSVNVYARVTPLSHQPSQGRGKEADSLGGSVLWADIDHVTDKEAAASQLGKFVQPPTMIVDSGYGIQAYWLLDQFETDLQAIKLANRGLQHRLRDFGIAGEVDSVGDLARVMRVPGTYNLKHGGKRLCRIIAEDPTRVYSLASFEVTERAKQSVASEPENIEWEAEPLPDNFLSELRDRDPKLPDRIVSENSARRAGAAVKPDGSVDRSRNDYHIAHRLLELGYSMSQTLSVLVHPEWFSGAKGRANHAYAAITVAEAQRSTQSDPSRYFRGRAFAPPLLGQEVMKEQSFLYLDQLRHYKDGVYRPDGEKVLQRLVATKLGDSWQPAHSRGTVAWISIKSSTELMLEEVMARNSVDTNLQNGMLEWPRRLLKPHDPSYLSLTQLPAAYDPDADLTALDAFIVTVLPRDAIPVFWEYVGSCLIRDKYWPKAFLLLVGDPDSGKSKVIELLQRFFGGSAYTASIPLQTLAERDFMREYLFGKYANLFADLGTTEAKDIGWIKTLTGDDNITVDRKFKEALTFKNTARLFFSANHYPAVRNPDDAYFDRALVIKCPNKFVSGNDTGWEIGTETRDSGVVRQADEDIMDKLTTPQGLAAVLNRALEGRMRLEAQRGFSNSESIKSGRATYRATVDSAIAFMEDATAWDGKTRIVKSELYAAYKEWCIERGRTPANDDNFFKRLRSQAIQLGLTEGYLTVEGRQHWCYVGRKLVYLSLAASVQGKDQA